VSRENVEIAKRAIDAYNRDMGNYAHLTTADFELFPALDRTVEGVSYRGREGIETHLGAVRDTWEEFHVLVDEIRDLGDRVLVLGRVEGRGRGSGVQVDTPVGFMFDFRGVKISRIRNYLDHDEALRAAGWGE
jgi:ketosteroid isomerase-like protein